MKKFLRLLLASILLVQIAFCIPCSAKSRWAPTQTTEGAYLEDFVVDFYLTRDQNGVSQMHVIEKINGTFPTSDRTHGLVRVIPFTNQNGKNLTTASDVNLDIIATRNGKSEPVANITPGDGLFKVYLGDPDVYVHNDQTYTLEYDFVNVITNQSGDLGNGIKSWQELYWDANGNDWSNSFDKVIATVHLDEDLADKYLDINACYTGRFGDSDSTRCETEVNEDGTAITFRVSEISPYENLTFVMAFRPDTFVVLDPPKAYSLVIVFGAIAISGSAMMLTALYNYAKSKDKRHYYKNQFVKPEYIPMRDVTVAEMAENSIKSTHGNPQVATLMELAVTHKIAIHKKVDEGKFRKKNIWSIEILNEDLLPEQHAILKILNNAKDFQQGETFELKNNGYSRSAASLMESFQKNIKERLENLGLLEQKRTLKKSWTNRLIIITMIWEMVAIGALLITISEQVPYLQLVGEGWLTIAIIMFLIATPIMTIILSCIGDQYLRHTEKGLDAARYLEGLKLYVKMAESERIQFLQSVDGADTSHQGVVKLYEKLLPYAVIFGLEKSWLREMGKYYEFDDVTEPIWYIGMGSFVASDFSSAVSEMSSFAGTSIAHSTTHESSSSGSGFSGGGGSGFSGGGGGGGGGGTW